MAKINNGGSAFPHESFDPDADMDTVKPGMSLRDYFAAAAFPSLLARLYKACDDTRSQMENIYEVAATASYEVADAMIAQRSVQS